MLRALIMIGLGAAAVALMWPWIGRIGFGHLPGDILVERDGLTFYAPIITGIVASLCLSLFVWLLSR
jgi:Protein of unknown function (DUF2905)